MICLVAILAPVHTRAIVRRLTNTYKSSNDIEVEYLACILAHVSPGYTNFHLLPTPVSFAYINHRDSHSMALAQPEFELAARMWLLFL